VGHDFVLTTTSDIMATAPQAAQTLDTLCTHVPEKLESVICLQMQQDPNMAAATHQKWCWRERRCRCT
jgi:hypothetical protein